jgi:hypothetical protein
MAKSRIITDRYKISPYEAGELDEAWGHGEKALQGAIMVAQERSRLWVVPCKWAAVYKDDGSILVTRKRNAPEKKAFEDTLKVLDKVFS